jgi:hypothetical protein
MIAEALAAHAKATVRVFDGRENTVGASEVGQCARKVYFAKNSGDQVYGAAPDEDYADARGAALRGQLFEDHFWVPALRARYGDRLLHAGDDQRTLVAGFLSATPDGVLIDHRPTPWQRSASRTSAATAASSSNAKRSIRGSSSASRSPSTSIRPTSRSA